MIYLDNNATTRPDPEVVRAMAGCLEEDFGNPSSGHVAGQRAAYRVAEARASVAASLGACPDEILFTASGTESDNLAIRGVLEGAGGGHIVTTAVEHEAVERVCEHLRNTGAALTVLGVDRDGQIDLEELKAAIRDDTVLVSVMYANNETGVLFPVAEIGAWCRERGVLVHTDAVQAVGKVPIDLAALPVDLLSLSAHKLHGPKGTGALFVRRGVRLAPQVLGGLQEHGLRAGTENVPGIAGLGAAAARLPAAVGAHARTVGPLRDMLEEGILAAVPGTLAAGARSPRLPNTSTLLFEHTLSEQLLVVLSEQGICASGGSACHSGSLRPSRVLAAMKIDPRWAAGAVRFSLSRHTTEAQIRRVLEILPPIVEGARRSAPAGAPRCPARGAAGGAGGHERPAASGPPDPVGPGPAAQG